MFFLELVDLIAVPGSAARLRNVGIKFPTHHSCMGHVYFACLCITLFSANISMSNAPFLGSQRYHGYR